MTTKHTATLPDGTLATRTSMNRKYSYCIATRPIYEVALADAKDPRHAKTDTANYDWAAYIARQQPDDLVSPPQWRNQGKISFSPGQIAHAMNETRGLTLADYLTGQQARRVAAVEADKAAGGFEKWNAAAWSSRLDLAQKAVVDHTTRNGGQRWAEGCVVPAEQCETRKKEKVA